MSVSEAAPRDIWSGTIDRLAQTVSDEEEHVAVHAVLSAGDPDNPMNTTMALERAGTPFERLSDDEWYDLGAAQQAWVLSQFTHGEHGAPDLKELGLLDAGDGWLRQELGELGELEAPLTS